MPPRSVPFLLALALAVAGCSGSGTPGGAPGPAPTAPVVDDPLVAGPFATERLAYDFGVMMAQAPDAVPPTYPVAVRGEVTVPDGPGPFPLVLFMHGRHGTCAVAGVEILGAYACPDAVVVTPVDSYQGYRPVADLLASHGYVVASIDANDINERDQGTSIGQPDYGAMARGELALHTAGLLAQANATGAAGEPSQDLPSLQGRIDLSRIGLMGHSRGGEGMARAVVLNAEAAAPLPIKALFALAPTDFARWKPTGVAFATLLPYCDGDVSTLHGSWMYDDLRDAAGAGVLHQVLSMGADHNFYNDRWTGDDWGNRDDPWCDLDGGDGRDAAQAQMAQGAAVMSSFLRMHVGGEAGFDAYWTGETPFPDGACAKPCAHRLLVSRHATDGHRFILSEDAADGAAAGMVAAKGCKVGSGGTCRAGSIGQAARTNVTWSGDGTLRFDVPEGAPPGLDVLTLRMAVHHADGATMQVRLLGENGQALASHSLSAEALAASPGSVAKKLVLSQVRVPLAGLDVEARLGVVELAFTGSGELQLADVMLQDEDHEFA